MNLRLEDLSGLHALTFAGMALMTVAAWIALISAHGEAALALNTIEALCLRIGGAIGLSFYPSVLIMWLLMSIAMMLPTAMPAILLYVSLARRMEDGRARRISLFIAGYLIAWWVFSAIAAAAQTGLRTVPVDQIPTAAAAGGIIVVAGLYQLSALKQACLAECRNPMVFLMRYWTETLPGTLRLGVLHGVICIGCCWAMMLLMFATGTMNLVWMALLGLVMLGEKILPGADRWGRHGGVLMIGAGTVTLLSTLI